MRLSWMIPAGHPGDTDDAAATAILEAMRQEYEDRTPRPDPDDIAGLARGAQTLERTPRGVWLHTIYE